MRTRTCLWDLDGTLADPVDSIQQTLRSVLHEFGVPHEELPSVESLYAYVGPPLRPTFRALLKTGDEALIERAVYRYYELFAKTGFERYVLSPRIVETLDELQFEGVEHIIATSKLDRSAKRFIEHFRLGEYFSGAYGSHPDGTHSEKRDLIRHIVTERRLNPAETLMVGDRGPDMRGARDNGLRAVGALWGYGSKEELQQSGATALAEEPRDVPPVALLRAPVAPLAS